MFGEMDTRVRDVGKGVPGRRRASVETPVSEEVLWWMKQGQWREMRSRRDWVIMQGQGHWLSL